MIGTVIYTVIAIAIFVLFIDYLNRRKISTLRQRGIFPLEGEETQADIERLIRMKRKIEAIKVYRSLYKVDLKTAKEAVDKLSDEMGKPHSY